MTITTPGIAGDGGLHRNDGLCFAPGCGDEVQTVVFVLSSFGKEGDGRAVRPPIDAGNIDITGHKRPSHTGRHIDDVELGPVLAVVVIEELPRDRANGGDERAIRRDLRRAHALDPRQVARRHGSHGLVGPGDSKAEGQNTDQRDQ